MMSIDQPLLLLLIRVLHAGLEVARVNRVNRVIFIGPATANCRRFWSRAPWKILKRHRAGMAR